MVGGCVGGLLGSLGSTAGNKSKSSHSKLGQRQIYLTNLYSTILSISILSAEIEFSSTDCEIFIEGH